MGSVLFCSSFLFNNFYFFFLDNMFGIFDIVLIDMAKQSKCCRRVCLFYGWQP